MLDEKCNNTTITVVFIQWLFNFLIIISYVLLLLDILKYHLSDFLFEAETIDHLLFNCQYSNMFWFYVYNWLSLKTAYTDVIYFMDANVSDTLVIVLGQNHM